MAGWDLLPLAALLLLLALWTLPWSIRPFTPHEGALWQVVGTSAALIAAATLIPNPFLAVTVTWFGLTPWWTMIVANRGWISPVTAWSQQASTQLFMLMGTILYLTLEHWWTPSRFTGWVWVLVLWATINTVFGLCRLTGWSPFRREIPNLGLVGLTQSPPLLACLLATAAMTLPTIGWSWALLLPLWAIVFWRIPSGRHAALWALSVTAAAVLALTVHWAFVLAIPGFLALPLHRRFHNLPSVVCRRQALVNGWAHLRRTHFLGSGLGYLTVLQPNPNHPGFLWWAAPHNEWLHLFMEAGPLPVAGFAASLTAALILLPTSSPDLTALLHLLFFAAYALIYFPGRVPFQILIWIAALSYADSRIW